MIFNTDNYYDGPVAPSPYPVGIEGALMHVYENECNYNALMKAVGISELKYYQETGKSLFVHEAGALSGFIEKAKAFFKKVIEKIKQIFHKFAAVMNQYMMSDREFIKKYSKELYRKNLADFEFNGYKFENLSANVTHAVGLPTSEYTTTLTHADINKLNPDDQKGVTTPLTSDQVDDAIETARGDFLATLTGGSKGKYTESEFREELHDILYGDSKEDLDKISIREWLQYIETTKDDVKKVEKQQKDIIKNIDDHIKALDKLQTTINKKDATLKDMYSGSPDDTKLSAKGTNSDWLEKVNQNLNNTVTTMKAESNYKTIYFGMLVQAVKDRNRQAKAICVKAIGYNRKESANYGYYGESSVDDLFAGVTIR